MIGAGHTSRSHRDLYLKRIDVQNPYLRQAFANSLIADALELTERFGIFSNELQTAVEPYLWKIILQEEIPLYVAIPI